MIGHSENTHVFILGKGVSAWLPAAILAAQLPAQHTSITVCDLGDAREDAVIARPSICRAHDIIGIDDPALARDASARPLHAVPVKTFNGGEICLPFGNYGHPYQGAAFHQYWLRAQQAGHARPLTDYNLALRLTEAGGFLGNPPKGLPAIDYGYRLPRQGYIALLKRMAEQAGAEQITGRIEALSQNEAGLIQSIQIAGSQRPVDLALSFATRSLPKTGAQTRIDDSLNGYHLDVTSKTPGLALHQLQTGTARLLSFWPGGSFTQVEKAEIKRLHLAEADRIAGMDALLEQGPDAARRRPGLARKCDIFAARGRIPVEDYEVFSKAEWLTALMASGFTPCHYDRLVDRLTLDETLALVKQTGAPIDQLLSRPKQARSTI